MLQNYHENKIEKLHIRARNLWRGHIRRRQVPKRYTKYGLFLLSRNVPNNMSKHDWE